MVSVHTEHCIDYHMNKCSFEAFSLHWCKTSVLHGHEMIVFIQCILLRTTTQPNSPKALPYLFRTTARFSTQVGDMLTSNLLNTQFDCTICAFKMLLEHQEKNRVTERQEKNYEHRFSQIPYVDVFAEDIISSLIDTHQVQVPLYNRLLEHMYMIFCVSEMSS